VDLTDWPSQLPSAAAPEAPQPVNAIAIVLDTARCHRCEDGAPGFRLRSGEQPAWIAAELIVPVQPAGSPAAAGQSTNVSAVALSADGRWLAAVDSIQHVVRLFAMDYAQHAGREVLVEGVGGVNRISAVG
jgi:hypothetical protein